MADQFTNKKRQLIPDWRLSRNRSIAKEISQSELEREPNEDVGSTLENLKIDFKNSVTLYHAGDLLSHALVIGESDGTILNAAQFVLKSPESNPTIRSIALSVIHPEKPVDSIFAIPDLSISLHKKNVANQIRLARKSLNSSSYSPLTWLDLSFLYSSIGLPKRAKNAISVALGLAPANTQVLRSASRFFMHLDEPERALYLLRGEARSKKDPRLASVEIAISSRMSIEPKLLSHGRRLIKSGMFSNFKLSELQSAIGTMELESGNHKKSKRLLKDSLQDPTDNTVAQAAWLSTNHLIQLPQLSEIIPITGFEAAAYYHADENNWDTAYEMSLEWALVQPYSAAPFVFGTFAAGLGLNNPSQALQLAEIGLAANKNNISLLNNFAYFLILNGQLSNAKSVLDRKILRSENASSHTSLIATRGLFHFRMGDPELGRMYYEKALSDFKKLGNDRAYNVAVLNFAREESLSQDQPESSAIHEAQMVKQKYKDDPFIALLIDRLSINKNQPRE